MGCFYKIKWLEGQKMFCQLHQRKRVERPTKANAEAAVETAPCITWIVYAWFPTPLLFSM